jgi:hypothetical protein
MQLHLKSVHNWTNGCKGGALSKAALAAQEQGSQRQSTISAMIVTPVSYQTFRRSNFTRFFQVSTTPEISLRALEANRLQTTKYV